MSADATDGRPPDWKAVSLALRRLSEGFSMLAEAVDPHMPEVFLRGNIWWARFAGADGVMRDARTDAKTEEAARLVLHAIMEQSKGEDLSPLYSEPARICAACGQPMEVTATKTRKYCSRTDCLKARHRHHMRASHKKRAGVKREAKPQRFTVHGCPLPTDVEDWLASDNDSKACIQCGKPVLDVGFETCRDCRGV